MTVALDPAWEAALRPVAMWAVPMSLVAMGVYHFVNAEEIRATDFFSEKGVVGHRIMALMLVGAGLSVLFLVARESGIL